MYCSRYMHDYGLTREQLGQIALNARKNAALTPYAVYREPLTMEDYLSARIVSTPFGLYDCDVPCDAAVAFVISHVDTVKDSRRGRGVRFEAVGTANTEPVSWDQGDLHYLSGVEGAANMLWSRTDLKPKDMDMAQLYDGFSFNTVTWLEKPEPSRTISVGSMTSVDSPLCSTSTPGASSSAIVTSSGFGVASSRLAPVV